MPLTPIPLSALTKRGVGLKRPEDVVVSRDGHVWASDEASACAEILADGTLRRVGKAGGRPNGINMDRQDRILIANFALDTPEPPFDFCLTSWNTFATHGRCPGCRHQWIWTSCLRCEEWSLHEDWYERKT